MNVLERAIKNFWNKQARENPGEQATNEDTWYRSLEIREIIRELHKRPVGWTLDVGCGNGFSTKKFASAFPLDHFTGIDYSEAMVRQALKCSPRNTAFYLVDVTEELRGFPIFHTIISERCLINITSVRKRNEAVLRLKNLLDHGGRMIIIENTIDGLLRLNKMRMRIGLPWIRVRWHNVYIEHDQFLAFLREHFEHVECRNIGSLYYFLSRVVYAKYAAMRGIEPDYNNWMNRFACKLPCLSWWWASPNMMYVCSGKKS